MVRLIETVMAAGIGAIDIAAEEFSKDKKVIGPLEAKDIYRFALTGGSLAASILNLEGKRPGEEGYSDLAFYVSLPLVEKSVYRIVKEATAPAAAVRLPTVRVTGGATVRTGGATVTPKKQGVIAF
jgi:hypothetical protein